METHSSSSSRPFLDFEILEIIKDYICSHFLSERSQINTNLRFDEDLGLDQLAFNEMLDFLEEEFTSMSLGFRIDMIERKDIELVSDLVETIRNRVAVNKKVLEDD